MKQVFVGVGRVYGYFSHFSLVLPLTVYLLFLFLYFAGTLRIGTTLCVPNLDLIIGKVTRIENNHKEVQFAKKSTQVCCRDCFICICCDSVILSLIDVVCCK